MQSYDLDFFTGNELIGECTIDLKQIMEDCTLVKSPINLSKKYYEDVLKLDNPSLKMAFDKTDDSKIWLPMHSKKDGKAIIFTARDGSSRTVPLKGLRRGATLEVASRQED